MLAISVHFDMDVLILCLGASADIKNAYGTTPLQRARERLTKTSDPEAKRCFEKVHATTLHHTH